MESAAAAAAKSLQSCPTLCNPIDGSPPGSLVPGILQARTLEWVAISFSNAWKWKMKVKSLSRVRLLATPRTAASQAPPSMGFSRQEYWSGVPLPSPRRWKCCTQKVHSGWLQMLLMGRNSSVSNFITDKSISHNRPALGLSLEILHAKYFCLLIWSTTWETLFYHLGLIRQPISCPKRFVR